MDFLTNNLTLLAGGTSAGLALWLLKKIPNEDLYSWVETGAYWAGSVMTLGLNKFKLWNKTVEPYVIDLVDNVVSTGIKEFIKGLRSDK